MDTMNAVSIWILFSTIAFVDAEKMSESLPFQMSPTDSNWDDFRCFQDWEIAFLSGDIDEAKNLSARGDIWGQYHMTFDDWSFQGIAWAIVMRDLLGVNVSLVDFDDGASASNIISQQYHDGSNVAFFHFALKHDYHRADAVEGKPSGITSQTRWLIPSNIVSEVESELGTDSTNGLFLDQWRTLANEQTITSMHKADEIVIPADDNGDHPEVWYPPQCDHESGAYLNCMVLLQFSPTPNAFDAEFSRDLIVENSLPIVIKYLGDRRTEYAQNNFNLFYNGTEKFRVIFQLNTLDTQSIDVFNWTTIVLPPENPINIGQSVVYIRPNWLSNVAIQLHHTIEYSVLLTNAYAKIQESIAATHLVETKDLRMEAVCDYIRQWNMWDIQGLYAPIYLMHVAVNDIGKVECDMLDDESLEKLLKTKDEVLMSPKYDFGSFTSVYDGFWAVFGKRHCPVGNTPIEEPDLALRICGYCLAGLAAALLLTVVTGTIYWRKEKIIVASSINMLAIIYLGAALALCFSFCGDDYDATSLYARMYVFQIGTLLMFSALGAKTWRLHKIHDSLKTLHKIELTDWNLVLRIGIILLLVVAFLSALFIYCPITIEEKIVDRNWKTVAKWDAIAQNAYTVLCLLEVVALIYIGKMSWNIKSLNEVYNESKYIGFILFGTVLIMAGYLLVDLLVDEAEIFIVQWYLVSIFVMLVLSSLMFPKFKPILQGTKYHPDSFEFDSITFSTSLMSKQDLRRMKKYLQKFGYHVYRKQKLDSQHSESSIGSMSKSTIVSTTLSRFKHSFLALRSKETESPTKLSLEESQTRDRKREVSAVDSVRASDIGLNL